MANTKHYISYIAAAIVLLPVLWSCSETEPPTPSDVPEGMVEIRPVLPGVCAALPRPAAGPSQTAKGTYPTNEETGDLLANNNLVRLPMGSTVWLIAESTTEGQTQVTYEKRAYVVYNPEGDESMSYLVPCTVNDDGEVQTMEGAPLYLKNGYSYKFYAISPARKLDDKLLAEQGKIGFTVKNGDNFYANDCRYGRTTPQVIQVHNDNNEAVQIIKLNPMMNQMAELKFQIRKGDNVHDIGIQPSGIHISGLQFDGVSDQSPNGTIWHMSQSEDDEPLDIKFSNKKGQLNCYDYKIDDQERVNISVPILPMYCVSNPIIVVFRLKVNGVPSTFEVMLNEKDFKAGYSYGYRGEVSIEHGIDVVTWQFVSWDYDVYWPFDKF